MESPGTGCAGSALRGDCEPAVTCASVTATRCFWGWGYEGAGLSDHDEDNLVERVRHVVRVAPTPIAAPTPEEIRLAPSRLRPPTGLAPWCRVDDLDRAGHTYGKSFRDVVRALERRWDRPPDVVVRPPDEAGVAAVLDWAARVGAVVIPYGGGSSVVGGVEAPADDDRPVISLDTGELNQVLEVDRVSRAARIEGGVLGPSLEAQLRSYGVTLRHYPQSFEMSTLGGWIATRSAGHYATLHTRIDDVVESIRAVTPSGAWESRRVPSSGAGPSADRLWLGSEGILGVITSAWVRVQPRPQYRASGVARFATWRAGALAVRALAQSGLWPASCRLLDGREAALSGAGVGDAHLLLVGVESSDHPVDYEMARAREIIRDHGGQMSNDRVTGDANDTNDAAVRWRSSFLRAPYQRDVFVRHGLIVETFETAVTWDRFDGFVDGVLTTAEAALREVDAWPSLVTHRITHAYPDGAALYVTVLAPGHATGRLAQWDEVKGAVMAAVISGGGTVTHHHGVGRDHRRGYDDERPDLFAAQLAAAKRVVDPGAILNPGVLIDPATRRVR